MKKIVLIFALLTTITVCYGQIKERETKSTTTAKPVISKFGALAIDRSNGFYYGFSFDYATLVEAEKKAIEECNKKSGNCAVVLSYSGTGCASYKTMDSNLGTAYGWGLAKTKEEADAIATKEYLKRSNGNPATNFVWSCNSANTGTLKEIYNASEEIEVLVKFGDQTWMHRNLDVSTFRNGDAIPQATTREEWERLGDDEEKPAWCYYNFDPENGKKYGKLYNWYAVNDARGLAPVGWHVPNKAEFEILLNFVGGEAAAYTKLRSKTGWTNNKNGKDEFGFNLFPNGYSAPYARSGFDYLGKLLTLWTSQSDGEYKSFYLTNNDERFVLYLTSASKGAGYGVRCIKN